MKYLHMQKLQHLYVTSNLLTKFQTEERRGMKSQLKLGI